MKVSNGTLIRTVLLFLALMNQIAAASGKPVIQVEDAVVTDFINSGITIITALVAWWKNNSFTPKAIAADEYKKTL